MARMGASEHCRVETTLRCRRNDGSFTELPLGRQQTRPQQSVFVLIGLKQLTGTGESSSIDLCSPPETDIYDVRHKHSGLCRVANLIKTTGTRTNEIVFERCQHRHDAAWGQHPVAPRTINQSSGT